MLKILAITKKEFTDTVRSPVAYLVLFISISIFNVFFYMIVDHNQEATLRDVFKVMEFMFVFFVPLVTMRLFAEEKRSGTLELLFTTPTSNFQIVMGKYFGALLFMTVLIGFTVPYYCIIEFYGTPDRLTALSGYAGIWLEAAFFISIGLMASSWTRSQIIAAISSFMIIFTLYFSLSLAEYVKGPAVFFIRNLSTISHAENFAQGLITVPDIVYYLSGIAWCIVVTKISLERKLWS